jgi:hypothetical protein
MGRRFHTQPTASVDESSWGRCPTLGGASAVLETTQRSSTRKIVWSTMCTSAGRSRPGESFRGPTTRPSSSPPPTTPASEAVVALDGRGGGGDRPLSCDSRAVPLILVRGPLSGCKILRGFLHPSCWGKYDAQR